MIEIIGANLKTGKRFSRFFESPFNALIYKKRLEHSKTATYIGWFNV